MNVLLVSKFYHPHVGGIENHVQAVAEGLADRHNVRVLAAMSRGRGGSIDRNGVAVHKTSSLCTALSTPLAPTFPMHLSRHARRADVVHHHLPNPLGATAELLVADAPTVCTYHSDIVRQTTALKAYKPLLYRFLANVDRIVVTSPRLLEHSPHLGRFEDKCEVIPLSIDVMEYGVYTGRDLDLVPADDPVVLTVGRLNYYKGTEYLIDAMTDVDAHLLVAGDGERRAALERQAADAGVDDKVTFLGHVPGETLQYCYNVADVFVLPSVEPSEAFGIVQLEAMAYGTPVVNTALPTGVPWVSKDGETGLTVPPRDADALATAINDLLADEERRTQYGQNARQRVGDEFDRDTMLDRIESVYELVV